MHGRVKLHLFHSLREGHMTRGNSFQGVERVSGRSRRKTQSLQWVRKNGCAIGIPLVRVKGGARRERVLTEPSHSLWVLEARVVL